MKRKIAKKWWILSSLTMSALITIPIVAAACTKTSNPESDKPKEGDNKKEPPKQSSDQTQDPSTSDTTQPPQTGGQNISQTGSTPTQKELNEFNRQVDLTSVAIKKWSTNFGPQPERSQTLPSKVDFSSLEFELEGPHKDKLWYVVESIVNQKDATGELEVSLSIKSRANPLLEKSKNFTFSGFATSNQPNLNDIYRRLQSDFDKYNELDQTGRYELDESKYLEQLKLQKENQPLSTLRPDLNNNNESKINDFNTKANEIKVANYESSAYKGFTLPKYDANGQFLGLSLDEKTETVKQSSWVDALGGRNWYQMQGLARTIPNEYYRKSAIQTYAAVMFNEDKERAPDPNDPTRKWFKTTRGTMWILDFEKPADGSYPTKWYFGTNMHVSDALTAESEGLSLTRLNEDIGTRTTLKLLGLEADPRNNLAKGFSLDKGVAKVIYRGADFLNSKPADFLVDEQKEKFKDIEEFTDFAVIEVDLTKHRLRNDEGTLQEFAKSFSNNYATRVDDHIKFIKESYLKNYAKIEHQLTRNSKDESIAQDKDELFITGYPLAVEDWFFRPYIDDDQRKVLEYNVSLWVNSDYRYYNQLGSRSETSQSTYSDKELDHGNYLSYIMGYRLFKDKPGITDAFITAYRNGSGLYSSTDGKQYIQAGLNYSPRHYRPYGGASGSSVRTQNNELVSVYHTAVGSAVSGLSAAFRSEGFDYQGLYGDKYHLPQYDLIYGGGKDQKNSYRQTLLSLYPNIKTNLFPNGVSEDQIPQEFRFKNQEQDQNPQNSQPSSSNNN